MSHSNEVSFFIMFCFPYTFQAKVEKKRDLANAYVKKRANPQPRKLPAWESDLKIMGMQNVHVYSALRFD